MNAVDENMDSTSEANCGSNASFNLTWDIFLYAALAVYCLYLSGYHCITRGGCLKTCYSFLEKLWPGLLFNLFAFAAWIVLGLQDEIRVVAVLALVFLWYCSEIVWRYGLSWCYTRVYARELVGKQQHLASQAVSESAVVGTRAIVPKDVYSNMTRPFSHCCVFFILQTILVKLLAEAAEEKATDFRRAVQENCWGYASNALVYFFTPFLCQTVLFMRWQSVLPDLDELAKLRDKTTVQFEGGERKLEPYEVEARIMMSFIVNTVYAKFVLLTFGVILAQAPSALDFVKDVFAVVFIKEIDNENGTPFTCLCHSPEKGKKDPEQSSSALDI